MDVLSIEPVRWTVSVAVYRVYKFYVFRFIWVYVLMYRQQLPLELFVLFQIFNSLVGTLVKLFGAVMPVLPLCCFWSVNPSEKENEDSSDGTIKVSSREKSPSHTLRTHKIIRQHRNSSLLFFYRKGDGRDSESNEN